MLPQLKRRGTHAAGIMEFSEQIKRDEPAPSYDGYTGATNNFFHSTPGSTISFGQKITDAGNRTGPTWGQRLLLAVISLILFIGMFSAVLVFITLFQDGLGQSIAVLGLILFFVLIITVNGLFNRRY